MRFLNTIGSALGSLCLLTPTLGFAQTWDFDVSMDGKSIGSHQFILSEKDNAQQVLKSDAKFNVKFLGINVYKYTHQADELWQNNCLKKLEAKTQENSKTNVVKGFQDKAVFKIISPKSAELNAECVMTFAYWNPKILQQQKLLNPQTGEYLPVKVSSLGKETILAKGSNLSAEHFKIDTEQFKLDVWYGIDGEWLALQSQTPDGRIVYTLK